MTLLPTSRKSRSPFAVASAVLSCALLASVAAIPAMAQTAAPAGPSAGDPQRGFKKAATCVGCHAIPGYKADFPVVYSVPMIGGQNAQYIQNALVAYRKGERRFPSMMATARSLSDQDIADLAAYFSSQR